MLARTVAVALLSLAAGPGTRLAAAEEFDSAAQQLVVMSDGRIVTGKVTRHAIGYYIERSGGSILVPSEQVRCVARDVRDAYRQQREQMLEPTSAMMIQLAEWCISYRLYDEAGDELRRALRRDPESDVARQMLDRLDRMLRADPNKSLSRPRLDSSGLISADVESLGGLSRPTAAEFTAKIQPLLINKCGNAGCHGSVSENEFRLTHTRIGSANHRRSSEMNLALALKYIDVAQPHQSQLLTVAQGAHGGSPLALFGGASGAVQEKLLKDWVQKVATERQTEEQKLAARTPLKGKSPFPVSDPSSAIQLVSNEEPAITERPLTGNTPFAAMEKDLLPGADRPPRPLPKHDPFDPAEFNRQFASPGSAKGRR